MQRDAESVRVDWQRMRLWMKEKFGETWWMRVVELTKKGQPHLHLILSCGERSLNSCGAFKGRGYGSIWQRLDCDCDEHDISRAWLGITGDSWMVDVKKVESGQAAAGYLSKYITKSVLDPRYIELGFKRIWSRSQNWPFERTRLLATAMKQWVGRPDWISRNEDLAFGFAGMDDEIWLNDDMRPHPVQARVGTDLGMIMDREMRDRIKESKLKKSLMLLGGLW